MTKYLTTNYSEFFSKYVFNKTLFHMNLISQDSSYDGLVISDTDLIKGIVDLLFTYTTTAKTEADMREQTISSIKELIKPYIHK